MEGSGRKRSRTFFSVTLLITLLLALFVWVNFKTVEVVGISMEPTFQEGDRLLMSRAYWMVGDVEVGDVVVVTHPETGDALIKRVAGLPGDVIDPMNVPRGYSWRNETFVVPENSVYLLGDNWSNSQDSRSYGPFALSTITGKVVLARVGGA